MHSAASYASDDRDSSLLHSSPPSPRSAGSLSNCDATPSHSLYDLQWNSRARSLFRSWVITDRARPSWSITPLLISFTTVRPRWNQCGRMYLFRSTARCTSPNNTRFTPSRQSSAATSARLRPCAAALGKLGGSMASSTTTPSTRMNLRNAHSPMTSQSCHAASDQSTNSTLPSTE